MSKGRSMQTDPEALAGLVEYIRYFHAGALRANTLPELVIRRCMAENSCRFDTAVVIEELKRCSNASIKINLSRFYRK